VIAGIIAKKIIGVILPIGSLGIFLTTSSYSSSGFISERTKVFKVIYRDAPSVYNPFKNHSVIIPLATDVTTANVQDNQMYNPIISSSTSSSISSETCFIIGDSGYDDDHKLYDLSTKRGFELVCPVQRCEHTPPDRLELIQFYESELGQAIYSWRSESIEPPIEHIKSVFKIDPLPVRIYQKAAGIVLLSILLYQILVYYNCKNRYNQRPKSIKHMLCS
jgi:Transposase DDE domain